jgi:hypothetical protein
MSTDALEEYNTATTRVQNTKQQQGEHLQGMLDLLSQNGDGDDMLLQTAD